MLNGKEAMWGGWACLVDGDNEGQIIISNSIDNVARSECFCLKYL